MIEHTSPYRQRQNEHNLTKSYDKDGQLMGKPLSVIMLLKNGLHLLHYSLYSKLVESLTLPNVKKKHLKRYRILYWYVETNT